MPSSWFQTSTSNAKNAENLAIIHEDITTLPNFMTLAASLGLGGPRPLYTNNLDSTYYVKISEGAQFEVFRRSDWYEGDTDRSTVYDTRNTPRVYKRISRKLYKTKNVDSLRDLRLEIQVLAQDVVRAHPNIVEIVGWGYDYPRKMFEERREEQSMYPPNEPIPVLILGEAHCSMDKFFTSAVFEKSQASSWSVRCSLALGVAAGLECLRELGVLHNDLKPENILVYRQSDPNMPFVSKLADFGLSITSVDDFRKYGRTTGWKPPESLDYDREEHGVCTQKALFKSESYVYGLLVLYIICAGSKSPELVEKRYDGPFPQFRYDRSEREKETAQLLKGQIAFSDEDLTQAKNCYLNLEEFFLQASPQDRSDVSPTLALGNSSLYKHWSACFEELVLSTAKLIPFNTMDSFFTGLAFYRSLGPRILEDLRATLTEDFPGQLMFSMAISSLLTRVNQDRQYVRKLINMSTRAKYPSLVGMGIIFDINAAIPSDAPIYDSMEMKNHLRNAIASGSITAIRAARAIDPKIIREAQAEFRSKGGYNSESWLLQDGDLAKIDLSSQLAAAQKDWNTADIPPLIEEMRKRKNSLLHVAAMLGNTDLIRAIGKAQPNEVNKPNLAGETPVYKSCVAGQYESALTLIELGADPSIRVGPFQVSCLHWIFNFPPGKMESIARLLLSKGIPIDAKVLPRGAKNEHEWVRNHHFPFHWPVGTPLHWAAHAESQAAVDVLLRCGARVDDLDIAGEDRAQTPLTMAIYRGSFEMATHLLSAGANAARLDGKGCSALNLLAANHFLYNTLNTVPKILLQWCFQGSYDNALTVTKSFVRMITSAGVDIDFRRKQENTEEWITPLQDAAMNNDAVGVVALLDAGADADAVEGYSGRLPLHIWAAKDMRSSAYPHGYIPALELLTARTQNKTARDVDGETFVHSALTGVDAQKQSDFELWKQKLEVLLKHCHGLSINDCDNEGVTLLLHVVAYSNMPRWNPLNAVAYLRGLGADITIEDNYGRNFLYYIGYRDHIEEDTVLSAMNVWFDLFPAVGRGTLLDASRNRKTGKTFLMEICRQGFAECVEVALRDGASVNLTNSRGYTALDEAVEIGNRHRLQAASQYMKYFGKWPGALDTYPEELFRNSAFDGGSGEGYLIGAVDEFKQYFAFPKIRDMLLDAAGRTGKELGTSEHAPDVKYMEQLGLEALGLWNTFERENQPYFNLWKRSYDLDN